MMSIKTYRNPSQAFHIPPGEKQPRAAAECTDIHISPGLMPNSLPDARVSFL